MTAILRRAIGSMALNALKVIVSFATGILVARGLGAEDYGTLAFLIASFTNSRMLLDMGTSAAFFTFISKSERPLQFFFYYGCWLGIQLIISLAFIVLIAPDDWIDSIWQGQQRFMVILTFAAIFSQQTIWMAITHVSESQRLTIRMQKTNLYIVLCHFIVVLLLVRTETIAIEYVLLFIALEFLLASVYMIRFFDYPSTVSDYSLQETFREYRDYCMPLLPFVWISMVSALANRWLLQHFSGSSEQAYYAVAVQFSTVAFLIATPVFNILWKEVSETKHQGDFAKLHYVYGRISRSVILISACFAGVCLPWTEAIISAVLGPQYMAAVMPLKIMLVFSLWQSLGAVNINMLYALELTTARTVIGISFALISLPLTYYVLAPNGAYLPGLDLGASGLALKMVLLGASTQNVCAWWISRKMEWKFDWSSQFVVAFTCVITGYLWYYFVSAFAYEGMNAVILMIVGMLGYLVTIISMAFMAPFLLGLVSEDANMVKHLVLKSFDQERS